MRISPKTRLAIAMFLCAMVGQAQAQLVGLWEFEDSGNLGLATTGVDLASTGTPIAVTGSGGGDTGASQLDVGDFYTVTHGIAPNGGGSFVNEWTLVLDVSYPASSVGSWMTFYQTSVGNANDGESFIRNAGPTGAIGVGDAGYSSQTTVSDTWYRVAFSVDNGNFHKTYVDGVEWVDGGAQGIDGRFSFDPTFLLFADNDGDDATINVSNAALFDTPLSPFQISALGAAGDAISFTPNPVLEVIIDRDDGTITLNNANLGQAQPIKGYSLLSPAGSLIEANYTPLAGSDSNWVQFTASNATSDLSEGHLTTGSIADQASIQLDNGSNGAWLQYYDEDDVTFEYLDGNGDLIQGDVTFVGTTQTSPFDFGDLNFDGSVNGLDWNEYLTGLGADLSSMSAAQAYRDGDLTGDLVNGLDDFLAFKGAFDAVNGSGSFDAMIAGVPEPATLLMLSMVGLLVGGLRLCRNVLTTLAVAVCVFAVAGQTQAQLVGLWEFENSGNLNLATIGSSLTPTGTVTSAVGSGGLDTGAASLDDGDFYTVTNPIGVNGGGATESNEYTIVMDINTASTGFNALLDQDGADDGDFFINGAGGIGISSDYAGTTNDGNWHRLVVSYDLNGTGAGAMTRYIDGVSFGTVNADDTIDGRFGLGSTFTAFSDNGGGEEATTAVSNLALFSTSLNPLQAGLLGDAGDPIGFFDPQLTLNVNKTTGNITMVNESGLDLPQPINFYEIVSGDGLGGDGLLSTGGWSSLSDQSGLTSGIDPVDHAGSPTPGAGNDPGETWDEGGGSGADILTEAFLLGSTTFNDAYAINLGNVYTGGNGGAEDLTFSFALFGGSKITGTVNYFTGASIDGDYNGNGVVDAADYTIWRDTLGSTSDLRADGDGNGTVQTADYAFWKSRFGNTSGSGSAVPEPSSLLLLGGLGTLLLLSGSRRTDA